MLEWLRNHLHEVNINLWFFSIKFGPKVTSLSGKKGPQISSGNTEPTNQKPEQEKEPEIDVETETPVDPSLAEEPEPTLADIEHPVSLEGADFEQRLLLIDDVAARLNNKNHTRAARLALRYLVKGESPDDPRDKKTQTWKQVRAACQSLIIEMLDRYRQRATYAALAGIVGGLARSVMSGKAMDQRNSWVVSVKSGLPTGYPMNAIHPALTQHSRVLNSPNELREWLRNPS
jgi:hypothetical protein